MSYLGQIQNLDWASPSRIFATTAELLDSQPNYEHEVAIALDTNIKYQGAAPIVGGWRYATGAPAPTPPVVPAPVNDGFTKLLLEFDGVEGSRTYYDTNAANWPRTWKQLTGFGCITNVGERFYSGALRLDGQTVIIAEDEFRFDFKALNFTIRGWFLCDFPLGIRRTLAGKSSDNLVKKSFWLDRTEGGYFNPGICTVTPVNFNIHARTQLATPLIPILMRDSQNLEARFDDSQGTAIRELLSSTVYSDTINPGWHEFKFVRDGMMLRLTIDGVLEDEGGVPTEMAPVVPGPITIGGYAPPLNGQFRGNPWIGGFDRFAVDLDVVR